MDEAVGDEAALLNEEVLIGAMHRRALMRWSAAWCSLGDFALYLNQRAPSLPAERMDWQERAADLYLVCACLTGNQEAVRELMQRCSVTVESSLRRISLTPAEQSEVLAELEKQLLVGSNRNQQPKLLSFDGRGPLRSWLLAVAANTALSLKKQAPRGEELDEKLMDSVLLSGPEPELLQIKQLSYPVLRMAFRAALQTLTDEERLLLLFRFVDGLGVQAIAKLFKRNHATVSRWITRLCRRVTALCREQLAKHGLSAEETQSLMAFLVSRLAKSFAGLIQEVAPNPKKILKRI
jgi:RNA polymerase sigma-70 factor (ECF subfamily)